jgi:hypothetical protein
MFFVWQAMAIFATGMGLKRRIMNNFYLRQQRKDIPGDFFDNNISITE